jgi:hypothetical protein
LLVFSGSLRWGLKFFGWIWFNSVQSGLISGRRIGDERWKSGATETLSAIWGGYLLGSGSNIFDEVMAS